MRYAVPVKSIRQFQDLQLIAALTTQWYGGSTQSISPAGPAGLGVRDWLALMTVMIEAVIGSQGGEHTVVVVEVMSPKNGSRKCVRFVRREPATLPVSQTPIPEWVGLVERLVAEEYERVHSESLRAPSPGRPVQSRADGGTVRSAPLPRPCVQPGLQRRRSEARSRTARRNDHLLRSSRRTSRSEGP